MRDIDAGIKLRGSLLRLHAFRPDGFTAADLAESAKVVHETARDFLKSFEGQYAVVIGSKPSASGKGRPSNLYVVTTEGYDRLATEIAQSKIRHFKLSDAGDVYRSLRNLERTLADIEEADERDQSDLVREATRELESCREDLLSLQALKSDMEARFRTSMNILETRLDTYRKPVGMLGDVRSTLERFGTFLDGFTAPDEPVLLLLDGIDGEDQLSKKVIRQSREKHLPVVEVHLATMEAGMRRELYESIVVLRESTHLIGCDIVITVNSRTSIGKQLVAEISGQPYLGSWNHKEWPSHGRAEVRTRRQKFLVRAAALIGSGEPRIRDFAIRCTAALSALEANYVSVFEESAKIFHDDFVVSRDPLSGIQQYMGELLCLDQSYTKDAERTFGTSLVKYQSSSARQVKA